MRRFLHSRLLRCIICFSLICALVVNISPIQTKAVDPVTLTGAAMIGLAACLAAGVVILPQTIELANQFGASFEQQIKDVTIVNVDKDTLWDYYIRMRNKLDNRFSPEWDPGEFHDDLEHALAAGLITAISSIMIAAVATGGFEAPSAEAPEGYAYYNGVLLPEYLHNLPAILVRSGDSFFIYSSNITDNTFSVTMSSVFAKRDVNKYSLSNSVWSSFTSVRSGLSICKLSDVIWSSADLLNSSGTIVLAGMEPTSHATIFVEPDIYVGDIPQKIQDGEDDPEKLGLPFIDPLKIFTNGDTALEDYTNIADKLKSGQLTYEDFVEQYRHEQESGGDSGGSTEPPVEDPTNPSEPGDNIDDILPYALDLTDFFPFCIPFDLYDLYSSLAAAPETPVFDLKIAGYTVTVDLSPWDDFAAYFRRFQLLLFVIGLAASSRKFIKW